MRTIRELIAAVRHAISAASTEKLIAGITAVATLCGVLAVALMRPQPGWNVVQAVYGHIVASDLSVTILAIVLVVSLCVAILVFGIMTLVLAAQLSLAFVVLVFFGNAVHSIISGHATHLDLATTNTITFIIVAAVLGLLSPLLRSLPIEATANPESTSAFSNRRMPINN